MTSEVTVGRDGVVADRDVGRQRGERREVLPGTDARSRRSRSTGVRSPSSPGTASCSPPRPDRRPTRSPPGDRSSGPRSRRCCIAPVAAHALFARPLVVAPTAVPAVELLAPATASCGATDGAGWRCPPGHGSRCAARACRCGWRGCRGDRSLIVSSPSSSCRCTAGEDGAVASTNGPGTTGSRGSAGARPREVWLSVPSRRPRRRRGRRFLIVWSRAAGDAPARPRGDP